MKGKTGNTYHRLDFHIIFGTKNKLPLLDNPTMTKVRLLFAEKAKQMGFLIHIANGTSDHIHILLSIPPRLSIAEVLKHLKGYSSYKITELFWQEGYGALSTDLQSFDRVFNYIKKQKERHANISFEDELNIIYKNEGITEESAKHA